VCARANVCVCARLSVRVCVGVLARVCVCACVCVTSNRNHRIKTGDRANRTDQALRAERQPDADGSTEQAHSQSNGYRRRPEAREDGEGPTRARASPK
jgi:hypothetical protein